ncbi:hypothetical protein BDQ17DRAFT_1216898, partial [Cyathus striatus]
VLELRRRLDPEAAAARHPGVTRKAHHNGISSIGPNEEWCVGSDEKLLNCMGIAIWGIIDKFSRMELSLVATPNAQIQQIPPALFLLITGMPLTVTGDKGSELDALSSLITTMRQKFQPLLPEDQLPAFGAAKSTCNITRERGWEKELYNVAHEYQAGKFASGFVESDSIHSAVSSWLWGRIVQVRLNEIMVENQNHRIRKQRGILLPSGARRIDLYLKPTKYGGEDRLIKADDDIIDDLLDQYDRPDLLRFGTLEAVALCRAIYIGIGQPKLSTQIGWSVFAQMIEYYI